MPQDGMCVNLSTPGLITNSTHIYRYYMYSTHPPPKDTKTEAVVHLFNIILI